MASTPFEFPTITFLANKGLRDAAYVCLLLQAYFFSLSYIFPLKPNLRPLN